MTSVVLDERARVVEAERPEAPDHREAHRVVAVEAVTQAADGDWDNVVWKASEQIPASRKVFTISPSSP